MTTNITPREALEKITKLTTCNGIPDKGIECDDCLKCAIHIATQALAPQESQQKTFTLEEVREIIENYYGGNEKAVLPLLAEFEKTVG